jgi:2-C-methyl-D-erythritol 4-phosphate cytidylyltransferase
MRATGPLCHALVPCAGTGSRIGSATPKQYLPLDGRAVVAHTLEALAGVRRLASTLVVLAPDDDAFERHVTLPTGSSMSVVRCGGATRAASVVNGLERLSEGGAEPHDWVLVHDAARCLVRPAWIDALIDACLDDPVGGLLAWPVADTLKSEREGRVAATLDRRSTWQAQTPQMFRLGALRSALARADAGITDEAGAMEAAGHAPKLVMGALENFKVTHAADLELAERLLKARR